MSFSKYEHIWKLLSSNNFDFDEEIPDNVKCTICEKIAIEPFAALCGCQFCSRCIKNYLKDEIKHCPGEKKECMEDLLELGKNLSIDLKTIHSIGKIVAKCPNQKCDAKSKLENMDNHLKMCEMRKMNCPYQSLGCENQNISKPNMKTHLDKKGFIHSQLIVEAIGKLTDELYKLQKVVEIKDKEIMDLKEFSKKNEMIIFEMKRNLDEKIINCNLMMNNYERSDSQNKEDTLKDEIENLKNDIIKIKKDNEHETHFCKNLKKNQEDIEETLYSITKGKKGSQVYNDREIIWKVDNFCKIKESNQWMCNMFRKYSRKFYMLIWCQEDKVGFKCVIMKGEFDRYVKWPMKHKVTLSIYNQDTMEVHKRERYEYGTYNKQSAFEKSEKEWNEYGIGNDSFMKVSDLESSPGLLVEGSLIVSCKIDF